MHIKPRSKTTRFKCREWYSESTLAVAYLFAISKHVFASYVQIAASLFSGPYVFTSAFATLKPKEHIAGSPYRAHGTRLMNNNLIRKWLPPKSHRHRKISMNSPIPQIPTNLRHKNVNLLFLPPQSSNQQCQTEPFQSIKNIDLIPTPKLLHILIPRPTI